MKVFAISDLHLSTAVQKPMDIFGAGWENHFEKICEDWRANVCDGDLVLLGGDMSWGMTIAEAAPDYALVDALPGIKIVGKGNHDYYWSSLGKMRESFKNFLFLQNNAYRIRRDGAHCSYATAAKRNSAPLDGDEGGIVICGSRGWNIPSQDSSEQDEKIYKHELQRLELSLSSAKTLLRDGDALIAMLHYPPFDADYASTAVTDLLEKYGVHYALYGHLHGKGARVTPRLTKNGVRYILTSCDLINNKLQFILEI